MTPALVLVDLQRGILARECQPHTSQEVLQRAVALADKFRAAGALVVLVHVSFAQDRADALKQSVDAQQPSGPLPPDWDILDASLKPDSQHTVVVKKRNWGAFYGTDLDLQLRRRGIDTIFLGGIATPYGVESTARDAYERAYQIYFLEDAMTTMDANDHRHCIERIFPRLGHVIRTDEVQTFLAQGG